MVRRTPVYAGAGAVHKLQGDALRLDCLVDGSPQPTIVWFKVSERGFRMQYLLVDMIPLFKDSRNAYMYVSHHLVTSVCCYTIRKVLRIADVVAFLPAG